MLTHSGMYALKAVVYLAGCGGGRPVQAGEIATAVGMPRNYLSKVLHALVRVGVLSSVRGPGGGFTLARDAGDVTVEAVVAPFEPAGARAGCVLGEVCTTEDCATATCAAHGEWGAIAASIRRFFQTTTVGALARGAARRGDGATGGAGRPRACPRAPSG